MEHKFYYNPNGIDVISNVDRQQFVESNPELESFMRKSEIALRPIDLDDFQTLCYWVIGQVISNSIAHKMINKLRSENQITPKIILGIKNLEEYIPYQAKRKRILNIAQFFIQNQIPNMRSTSSKEVIKYYSQIQGIGPWTVKMLLIYNYGRLDICAFEDLGVRQGLRILYQLKSVPNIPEARKLTHSWGNLATLGSLLAWKML